jgi:hypothetical protein
MLTNEDRDITPRQAFSIDLMELVQNLQKEGLEILIAGDFNAYITSSGILKELQDKCHLFRINDTTGIVSYRHGTKCLDHVFASHKLSEAVTKLHYEEYPSDYYSDHRPIFIQLDIKALQSSLKPPQEPKRRRLYSKDPENVKLYIERKFKLMQQYKIEDLLSDLEDRINALQAQQCSPDTALLHSIEQVDQHLTRISLEAETSIKKRGPHKWNLATIQCNREYLALRYKQKLLRPLATTQQSKQIVRR